MNNPGHRRGPARDRARTRLAFGSSRPELPISSWKGSLSSGAAIFTQSIDEQPQKRNLQVAEDRVAYSVEEAAAIIGIGRTLAWTLVRSGELPSIKVAGRVLIRRRQLVEWLDELPQILYPSA